MLVKGLVDYRDQRRIRHTMPELLQQVLLSFMQYSAVPPVSNPQPYIRKNDTLPISPMAALCAYCGGRGG